VRVQRARRRRPPLPHPIHHFLSSLTKIPTNHHSDYYNPSPTPPLPSLPPQPTSVSPPRLYTTRQSVHPQLTPPSIYSTLLTSLHIPPPSPAFLVPSTPHSPPRLQPLPFYIHPTTPSLLPHLHCVAPHTLTFRYPTSPSPSPLHILPHACPPLPRIPTLHHFSSNPPTSHVLIYELFFHPLPLPLPSPRRHHPLLHFYFPPTTPPPPPHLPPPPPPPNPPFVPLSKNAPSSSPSSHLHPPFNSNFSTHLLSLFFPLSFPTLNTHSPRTTPPTPLSSIAASPPLFYPFHSFIFPTYYFHSSPLTYLFPTTNHLPSVPPLFFLSFCALTSHSIPLPPFLTSHQLTPSLPPHQSTHILQ